MSTTLILVIVLLVMMLYLCVGFIVYIVHTLGNSRQQPTGMKRLFLLPFDLVVRAFLYVTK